MGSDLDRRFNPSTSFGRTVSSWLDGVHVSLVNELLLIGSRSDWELRERTLDQLIPRSSSLPTSVGSTGVGRRGTGVCRNAELKSLRGASNPSVVFPPWE